MMYTIRLNMNYSFIINVFVHVYMFSNRSPVISRGPEAPPSNRQAHEIRPRDPAQASRPHSTVSTPLATAPPLVYPFPSDGRTPFQRPRNSNSHALQTHSNFGLPRLAASTPTLLRPPPSCPSRQSPSPHGVVQ